MNASMYRWRLALLGVEPARDLLVRLGLEVLEGQVLQLRLDLVQPEPVRQRGEQVLGLGRDPQLLLGRHGRQGPHVVEPVGELDQDHPDVRRHRQHELADVLGPAQRPVLEHAPDLGHAVGDRRDGLAELAPDQVERQVGVLDRVVEQRRRDGHVVHPDVLGRDQRDLQRVARCRARPRPGDRRGGPSTRRGNARRIRPSSTDGRVREQCSRSTRSWRS